jgi:signal transduction histidine kinase
MKSKMVSPPAETSSEAEQFAAYVAHDLNNLLTGILGNLDLMQLRAQRQGITIFDAYLDGARSAGGRAALFTQRLLAYSGRTAQDFSVVPVASLICELVEPLRARGLPVSAELADGGARVFCDVSQAEFALHELLLNARDATAEGGDIVVASSAGRGFVTITVRDTGVGMAPEILARATEAFFTTRPNGAGKGLGLAIVARFAHQSGGTLHMASELGRGTVVRLRLPESPAE